MYGVTPLSIISLVTFGFTLTLLLSVLVSRELGHTADATVVIGFGQELFTLHLNGTRYQIRLIPAFFVTLRTADSRAISAGMIVASSVMMVFGTGLTLLLLWNCWETRPVVSGPGISVTEVMPKGAAARAGMKPGLRLLSIDNQPIRNVEQLVKAGQKKEVLLRAARPGQAPRVYRLDVRPHWYSTRQLGLRVVTPPPAQRLAPESMPAALGSIAKRIVAAAPRYWKDSRALNYRRAQLHTPNAQRMAFLVSAINLTVWLFVSLAFLSLPMLVHWRMAAPFVGLVMLLRPGRIVIDSIGFALTLITQADETAARLMGFTAAFAGWFLLTDIPNHAICAALVEYVAETRALGLVWKV